MQPRVIQPEELDALDLAGRAFASREGLTHFRGTVRRAVYERALVRVEVTRVQRKREMDEAWGPQADFAYEGNPLVTSLFLDSDGSLRITIMYVGQIRIRPEGAPPPA